MSCTKCGYFLLVLDLPFAPLPLLWPNANVASWIFAVTVVCSFPSITNALPSNTRRPRNPWYVRYLHSHEIPFLAAPYPSAIRWIGLHSVCLSDTPAPYCSRPRRCTPRSRPTSVAALVGLAGRREAGLAGMPRARGYLLRPSSMRGPRSCPVNGACDRWE